MARRKTGDWKRGLLWGGCGGILATAVLVCGGGALMWKLGMAHPERLAPGVAVLSGLCAGGFAVSHTSTRRIPTAAGAGGVWCALLAGAGQLISEGGTNPSVWLTSAGLGLAGALVGGGFLIVGKKT